MTTKLRVYGEQKIDGKIQISGAKNAALPLLSASLLSEDGLFLTNVPPLSDVYTMLSLLEDLGVTYEEKKNCSYASSLKLHTDLINDFTASYEKVKKMRASILVLGPLLARFGQCVVSLPGGCAIGVRPIDLHLKGMQALGADIVLKDGYVYASSKKGLRGAYFEFPIVSVTGTENLMMAAALADGTTIIKNAAKEPEIVDLANCLNAMGARISGQGTEIIEINGVTSLGYAEHRVIPDRIEAGTYAIAAGITKGKVDLLGGNFRNLLPTFVDSISKTGVVFTDIDNGIRAESSGEIDPIDIDTRPFPGFPTDLQAQSTALLCLANGRSNIHENIWENRFMHVAELARMGADINISNGQAAIKGVNNLVGAPVMATDLRASFSLVLAAMAAKGESVIDRLYHLDRGYCAVEEKLAGCGVTVERC